jgi:hypothetical protein
MIIGNSLSLSSDCLRLKNVFVERYFLVLGWLHRSIFCRAQTSDKSSNLEAMQMVGLLVVTQVVALVLASTPPLKLDFSKIGRRFDGVSGAVYLGCLPIDHPVGDASLTCCLNFGSPAIASPASLLQPTGGSS